MTKTSDDKHGLEDVSSDNEIYARVDADVPGAVTDETQRPDLPALHGIDKTTFETGEKALDAISTRWVVAREGDQIPEDFEVWIPQSEFTMELQPELNDNTGLFRIEPTGTSIQVGTDVGRHFATELYWVSHIPLTNAHDEPVEPETDTTIRAGDSAFDIDEDQFQASIPDEYIDNTGEWIRGADTVAQGNDTSFEIFVPRDEYQIIGSHAHPQIAFTSNSITRGPDPSTGRNVTDRQEGLYVDQIHVVSEDAVPDTTDNFVGGTVHNHDDEPNAQ